MPVFSFCPQSVIRRTSPWTRWTRRTRTDPLTTSKDQQTDSDLHLMYSSCVWITEGVTGVCCSAMSRSFALSRSVWRQEDVLMSTMEQWLVSLSWCSRLVLTDMIVRSVSRSRPPLQENWSLLIIEFGPSPVHWPEGSRIYDQYFNQPPGGGPDTSDTLLGRSHDVYQYTCVR